MEREKEGEGGGEGAAKRVEGRRRKEDKGEKCGGDKPRE